MLGLFNLAELAHLQLQVALMAVGPEVVGRLRDRFYVERWYLRLAWRSFAFYVVAGTLGGGYAAVRG